jgi:hypothetical protein
MKRSHDEAFGTESVLTWTDLCTDVQNHVRTFMDPLRRLVLGLTSWANYQILVKPQPMTRSLLLGYGSVAFCERMGVFKYVTDFDVSYALSGNNLEVWKELCVYLHNQCANRAHVSPLEALMKHGHFESAKVVCKYRTAPHDIFYMLKGLSKGNHFAKFVELVQSEQFRPDRGFLLNFAENGNLEAIRWFKDHCVETFRQQRAALFSTALFTGSIDILQFLYEEGVIPMGSGSYTPAVRSSNMAAIQWLQAHACPLPPPSALDHVWPIVTSLKVKEWGMKNRLMSLPVMEKFLASSDQ